MEIVLYVTSLGSLICWIMTLVQMFKRAGALQGILGIITCGLWAFVWGWLNVKDTNQKTHMMVWTVCIVLGMVANFVVMGSLVPAE